MLEDNTQSSTPSSKTVSLVSFTPYARKTPAPICAGTGYLYQAIYDIGFADPPFQIYGCGGPNSCAIYVPSGFRDADTVNGSGTGLFCCGASIFSGPLAGLNFDTSNFDGIVWGKVSLSSVPEPTTWLMMLVGFGGIGMVMRKRKPVIQIA